MAVLIIQLMSIVLLHFPDKNNFVKHRNCGITGTFFGNFSLAKQANIFVNAVR